MIERGGGTLEARDLAGNDPVAQAVAEMVALVKSSLTTTEAAARLGVDPSRIRQRLAERTLYGFEWEGRWLLPSFQFEEDRFVRGLEAVFPLLDPELSPIEVESWLSNPDPDLHAEKLGRDLTPLEWLRLGYPIQRLAHIARNL
ncbi:MAG: hypothetical protein HY900_32595 [Deltaproteobacteria bacterium]|nr:hypothetical protein [Deltaproteobacteria bacterium]